MSWRHWWVYDPGILIREWALWPTETMDYPRQLNALTRAVLLIFLILLLLKKYKVAWWLLFLGLTAIILAGYQVQSRETLNLAARTEQSFAATASLANRPYNPERPLVSHLKVEEAPKYSEQLRQTGFAVAPRRGE